MPTADLSARPVRPLACLTYIDRQGRPYYTRSFGFPSPSYDGPDGSIVIVTILRLDIHCVVAYSS
ncbi:MAG: hypothetical protein NVS4B7_07580 [Ktedonobacteraceae bacterium]